ncbi:hypothetical protein H0I76_00365 [Limibaculum sp. M0105]|uniref:Uncharacterized protein n=1 Tax=Thermohalobaculum xanthum TaxID=2753746 RepID=A0A8J7M5A3_9RHOB|nr:hypothetical protein [Thermohalobaculum xanthum]MBK0397629.1 hypothetical protein [Thermohalobaculum xanthum]
MTIAAAFFVVAFAIGWFRATRREGTLADKLQWGAAHGIPAGLVGLAIAVLLVRSGG